MTADDIAEGRRLLDRARVCDANQTLHTLEWQKWLHIVGPALLDALEAERRDAERLKNERDNARALFEAVGNMYARALGIPLDDLVKAARQ